MLAQEGGPVTLLDEWDGADAVVVIDATSSGSAPGTIRRFEAHDQPLPAVFSRQSTDSFGVAEAVELASRWDSFPHALSCSASRGATSHRAKDCRPTSTRRSLTRS